MAEDKRDTAGGISAWVLWKRLPVRDKVLMPIAALASLVGSSVHTAASAHPVDAGDPTPSTVPVKGHGGTTCESVANPDDEAKQVSFEALIQFSEKTLYPLGEAAGHTVVDRRVRKEELDALAEAGAPSDAPVLPPDPSDRQ